MIVMQREVPVTESTKSLTFVTMEPFRRTVYAGDNEEFQMFVFADGSNTLT
jgi:hypothetical protein